MSISIVTVSKGRLSHLKESLPRMTMQGVPVIVVDYGCPEQSGHWVRQTHPEVNLVEVTDDAGFSVARARNMGAAKALTDWVAFVDADILLPDELIQRIAHDLHPGNFIRVVSQGEASEQNTWGTCVIERSAFEAIGGYDETFRGWGGEDDDLYQRLKMYGLKEHHLRDRGLSAIPHHDSLRTAHYEQKDKVISFIESRLYREAKYFVMRFYGITTELTLETRQAIRAKIKEAMEPWLAANTQSEFEVRLQLNQLQNLCSTHQLSASAALTLKLPRVKKESKI